MVGVYTPRSSSVIYRYSARIVSCSFKVSSAFASTAELSAVNVSAGRVLSLEGYPGVFQTPPRHARALAALTTPDGRRRQ